MVQSQEDFKLFLNIKDFAIAQKRTVEFANGIVVYHYICDDENVIYIPKSKSSVSNVSFPMTARSEVIDYIRNNLPVEGEVISERYECELHFAPQHCIIVDYTSVDDLHTDMKVFFIDFFLFSGKVDIPISDIEALHAKAREHGASFLVQRINFNELQMKKSQYKEMQDKSCKRESSILKRLSDKNSKALCNRLNKCHKSLLKSQREGKS